MKELVVISGKGGTGKTSVVASFAALANNAVIVDCDVDAADLHLVLQPRTVQREDFTAGSKARIKPGHCTACGKCEELCRFDAIYFDGPGNGRLRKGDSPIFAARHGSSPTSRQSDRENWDSPRWTATGRVTKTFRVDTIACEGCGVCFDFCAENAIEFEPAVCGQWFISETRCGPMVHARLGIAAENSGKLVTQLRRAAQQVAARQKREVILCDGSPGIGCPVIASLTGASLALFVVEPTASGEHDFLRVAQLARQLGVPGIMAVNKSDLNDSATENLEALARERGIAVVGRIPYDRAVTEAQIARKSVVEASDGAAARAVRALWGETRTRLDQSAPAAVGGLVELAPER
ncbi:MAG: ATP-binding protein [Thermoguttaceae bacterium]|nr:ATP-binding protein [Thermoguttaceae bacterium]